MFQYDFFFFILESSPRIALKYGLVFERKAKPFGVWRLIETKMTPFEFEFESIFSDYFLLHCKIGFFGNCRYDNLLVQSSSANFYDSLLFNINHIATNFKR
jgi:hypothetical protein